MKREGRSRLRNRLGVTLTELVVATAIISVVFVAFLKVTAVVAKGVQYSKFRSLATVLAQEKIQVIKQLSYYKVLVTITPLPAPNFPAGTFEYDNLYFPPETLNEGGITYTRYTLVEAAAEVSGPGTIVPLPATTPDTGMRLITVTIVWRQGPEFKYIQVRSIANNPDSPMSNAAVGGTVRTGGTPLTGALITITENAGWSAISNGTGKYNIALLPGDYTVVASLPGYFTQRISTSVGAQQALTALDFSLTAMASGTITGTAWINNRLVMSQVVGSTPTSTGYEQEWVEVFNPTTWTWTVNGDLSLWWKGTTTGPPYSETQILYSTVTNSIGPGKFYLFANTTTVKVLGTSVSADAVWSNANTGNPDLPCFNASGGTCWPLVAPVPANGNYRNAITIQEDGGSTSGGGLKLMSAAYGVQDRFGWKNSSAIVPDPDVYEGASFDTGAGLTQLDQFRRFSSTAGVNAAWAPSYDSGSNTVDWTYSTTITAAPRNSATAALPIVAGVPAVGARATATDDLSGVAIAAQAGSPPYALFALPSVATGTWNVLVASNSLTAQISTVTMTASATVWIPNAASSPTWPVAGIYAVNLTTQTSVGYVSGRIYNAAGTPLGSIPVGNNVDTSKVSGSDGRYTFPCTPGVWDIVANLSGTPVPNASYVSKSSASIVVDTGTFVNGIDFYLDQGGRITGKITRDGINAVPGIAVIAQNSANVVVDQQVSGANGIFTFVDLTTDTYDVSPVLDRGETVSNPASGVATVAVTVGATVDAGTFTVTGAFGRISGKATYGGAAIQTGVMIVASTGTVASLTSPPSLSTATLTGLPYYIANTREDGSYDLDIRGSTNPAYNLVAFYTSFANSLATTPSVSTKSYASVGVYAGSTTANINFSFP